MSLLHGATCFQFLTLAQGGESQDFLIVFILYIDLNPQVKWNCFPISELVIKSYEAGMPANEGEEKGQGYLGQCALSPGILVFPAPRSNLS